MRSLLRKILMVAWSAVLAFLILGLGQGIWGALLVTNLKTIAAIPWAVPLMGLVLWLMWKYLCGSWWPRSTSEARRRCLRARRVPVPVSGWALVEGLLSIVALAGYWIVLFQLVKMSPNTVPDLSKFTWLTTTLVIVMASLVSPVTEESAFRGYCQVILEREFNGTVAVVISSFSFAMAHVTHGLLWPKLLVYFLVGLVFGVTAYLTRSTIPALPVHIVGDMIFFILVWPYDAGRQFVWESGADKWFWIHARQAVLFTALAIPALLRLAKVSERLRAAGNDQH